MAELPGEEKIYTAVDDGDAKLLEKIVTQKVTSNVRIVKTTSNPIDFKVHDTK